MTIAEKYAKIIIELIGGNTGLSVSDGEWNTGVIWRTTYGREFRHEFTVDTRRAETYLSFRDDQVRHYQLESFIKMILERELREVYGKVEAYLGRQAEPSSDILSGMAYCVSCRIMNEDLDETDFCPECGNTLLWGADALMAELSHKRLLDDSRMPS